MSSFGYHFCTLNESSSLKPIPSLDFVQKIIDICNVPNTLFDNQQRNIYDRKNHILHINNFVSYQRMLYQRHNRSVSSFQKQLKMMGYKKKKIRQHNQVSEDVENQKQNIKQEEGQENFKKQNSKIGSNEDIDSVKKIEKGKNFILASQNFQNKNNERYMFIWRGNKSRLISGQFQLMEENLSNEIERLISLKQLVSKTRKSIDNNFETIIMQTLINDNETDYQQSGTQAISSVKDLKGSQQKDNWSQQLVCYLQQMRIFSNSIQQESKSLVSSISQSMANELTLFRTLQYRQIKIQHHNSQQMDPQDE